MVKEKQMNKTKLGRLGVLFLALIFVIGLIPVSSVAATTDWFNIAASVPDGADIVATQSGFAVFQLWHYSGGYWGIHVSDPLRIYDSQITGNIEELANMIDKTVSVNYALPSEVKSAISTGKKVGVCVSHAPYYDYFNMDRGTPRVKIENNELSFEAYPKFHLINIREFSYDDYVDNLNKRIPFVNPQYGLNAYSMFTTGGTHLGVGSGYFNPSNPTELGPEGTIHPSQIANSSGKLVSGFKVSIGGKLYDSKDVRIGYDTFQDAGAVAFSFQFYLNITYYEVPDTDVAVTAITPTLFTANKTAMVQVTAKNVGNKDVNTYVKFSIPGITDQTTDVSLKAGESKTLLFTFAAPSSGSFPMTAEINPDRSFSESDYTNNKLTVTGQVQSGNDVAITKIEKTSYPATSVVMADVTVTNLGSDPVTTPVEFSIPGLTTQKQDVYIPAGQCKVLHFKFSTPASGTLNMTAEANKDRKITERDYSNNMLAVQASIVPVPSGSASCSDTITWTETDSHSVSYEYWCDNHEEYHTSSYTCYHTFTYETKLSTSYNISPKTLKSGYGFAVDVSNSISTRMVSNSGCGSWGNSRSNSNTPSPPDKAQVKLGWTVKNKLGTQQSVVDLKLLSRTASVSKFEPNQNPISELKSKLIYTDVALAGTKTSPKMHKIIISIAGGGVNGIPFCKEITDNITINGVMYEDDATGAH